MTLRETLDRKEPIIYLVSPEEGRAEREIQKYCEQSVPPRVLYRWTCTCGLEKFAGGVVSPVALPEESDGAAAGAGRGAPAAQTQAQAPLVPVLRYLVHQCPDDGVFVIKDAHHYLRGGSGSYHPTVSLTTRALRDAFYDLRANGRPRKIVLLSPDLVVPTDLEKEVRIYDMPLPSRADLLPLMQGVLRRADAIARKDRGFAYRVADPVALAEGMVSAAVGLTQLEVEYLLENLLYVDRSVTDDAPARLVREKQQIIRKSGVLEYVPPEDLRGLEVGGLEAMLRWLRLRKHVFDNRERALRDYGIGQVPRGVLLAGISGCGKSLVCKKIASEWGCPLLRLDVGAIFDRFVGASEERIRKALAVAESVAPCILWVDEIEKGFAAAGGGGDSGTGSRVLGTFLVWMQEKKAPVFIAATANDITALPPELLRPGRFDNRFFVGCPGARARREIFEIHLRARQLEPSSFDLDGLVGMTFAFTGAEIEQVVLDSAYDAFYERRRARDDDLMRNIRRSRPLVQSLGLQMRRILELLNNGRMELASEETIGVQELADRLHIALA